MGKSEKKEEVRKPSVVRLLALGHSVEYSALRFLEKLPGYEIKFKQQTVSLFTLPSGQIVEGSVDCVLWSDTQERGVLDCKSVGNRWSASFKSKWEEDHARLAFLQSVEQFDEMGFYIKDPMAFIHEVGEHALVSNIGQVNGYCMSQFMQERGITFGSIYRYEKNSSQHTEIRFKPSEELFEHLKKRYSDIETKVLAGKVSEIKKDFALGSMACTYCPYQQDCYPGATKKEIYKGFPEKKWATRTSEMEGGPELEALFEEYLQKLIDMDQKSVLEQKILVELEAHSTKKVKLANGRVFEVVSLKSPKPHLELRAGKE